MHRDFCSIFIFRRALLRSFRVRWPHLEDALSYFAEMRWRGLINQVSDPLLGGYMDAGKFTLYCGFDPSAPSLHVGNLIPILGLRRAQLHGHKPIALVGGATGIIGDPSGKSAERKLLPYEAIERNWCRCANSRALSISAMRRW